MPFEASSEIVRVDELSGSDLAYWVARANLNGHPQERNVLRRHYGRINQADPSGEPNKRAFVVEKLGSDLPPRSAWH